MVDDGSTDDSAEIARPVADRLIVTTGQIGPAAARNVGSAQACGRYLFFIDADCELHVETLSIAHALLTREPHLDALFGSYDDTPAAINFAAQYKNLFHHFTHQTSAPDATTFWTGCGCVRRDRFCALSGFDALRYPHPSIEDIEFGYRLTRAGGTIRLVKEMQVKHLKAWTSLSMWRSDIVDRALPWTRLLLDGGSAENNLNLRWQNRLSTGLIMLLGLSLPNRRTRRLIPVAASVLLALNAELYCFFLRKKGIRFTLRAIAYHWLYYGYSGTAFAFGVCRRLVARLDA